MKRSLSIPLLILCMTTNAKQNITIIHKRKPFYFRFVPKLKSIQSKKVITATIEYVHPTLGACTYEIVKDLKKNSFYGWCTTKKIPRRKTKIFQLSSNEPLPPSEHNVELGLNHHKQHMIEAINKKQNE